MLDLNGPTHQPRANGSIHSKKTVKPSLNHTHVYHQSQEEPHCDSYDDLCFQVLLSNCIFSPFLGKDSHVDVSENNGTPKSSILIGFSIINHPFGVPLFLETPRCDYLTNIFFYNWLAITTTYCNFSWGSRSANVAVIRSSTCGSVMWEHSVEQWKEMVGWVI